MKKIALILALITLVFALASCGKEIIGLMPIYVGDPVTEENHEFRAEDFSVWVAYKDGQAMTDDFTFKVVDFYDGTYQLEFTHKNVSDYTFVTIVPAGEDETAE